MIIKKFLLKFPLLQLFVKASKIVILSIRQQSECGNHIKSGFVFTFPGLSTVPATWWMVSPRQSYPENKMILCNWAPHVFGDLQERPQLCH